MIGISLTHSLLELYFRTLFNWTVKNIPSFSLIPPRHSKSKCRLLATNEWFISTGTIFWISHTSEHDFSWKSSIKITRETPRKTLGEKCFIRYYPKNLPRSQFDGEIKKNKIERRLKKVIFLLNVVSLIVQIWAVML